VIQNPDEAEPLGQQSCPAFLGTSRQYGGRSGLAICTTPTLPIARIHDQAVTVHVLAGLIQLRHSKKEFSGVFIGMRVIWPLIGKAISAVKDNS